MGRPGSEKLRGRLLAIYLDQLVDAVDLDALSRLVRPEDLQRQRAAVAAQAEMHGELVLVPLPRSGFDVARERTDLRHDDAHLGTDGRSIDFAVGRCQLDLEPMVIAAGILEQLAVGDDVEIAIVVVVPPGRLKTRANASKACLHCSQGEPKGSHLCIRDPKFFLGLPTNNSLNHPM